MCVGSSLFVLDLMSQKPARGFYTISLSVAPQKEDQRLLGTTGAEVRVRVCVLAMCVCVCVCV